MTLPSFLYAGKPYHVDTSRCGASEMTMACIRSARPRSGWDIAAIASRQRSASSAFLAPPFSARSSAARAFLAAISSALKPESDWVLVLVAIRRTLGRQPRPGFSIPDRLCPSLRDPSAGSERARAPISEEVEEGRHGAARQRGAVRPV